MPSLDVAINALRAEVGAKKFDKSVKKIQRGADGVDRSITKNDKSMNRFGAGLGRLAVGLIGVGAAYKGLRLAQSSVREFAMFEQQLANVSTMLTTQTMSYLPGYKKELRSLSIEFGQTTETLSKGLYDILSASIGAADALDVLRVSSKAAIGGLTTTAIAADAITTVMNAYGFAASDAEKISDILFATVKGGKLTFGELAGSIGKVVSIAATAGLTLEQVSATIATMTRNGISADMAMTSLKAIITSFISPTKEAQIAASEFNLTLSANTLETIGLTGAMELLKDATAEETSAIFPNVRALLGSEATRKNVVAMVNDHAKALDHAGLSEEAYTKNANTTMKALERNKQLWADVKRQFGEGIAPEVNAWLQGIQLLAKEWNEAWGEMNEAQKRAQADIDKRMENWRYLRLIPAFNLIERAVKKAAGSTVEFNEAMHQADVDVENLVKQTDALAEAFERIEEVQKKPFDITAGIPARKVEAVVKPEITDEEKKLAADRTEAYRRMYDDMDARGEASYQNRLELLNLEKEDYAKYIDDKVLLEQWFAEQKAELDLQRDMSGDDFQAGFTASIETMQMQMMTWGEIGAQSAETMKTSFSGAVKSMIMNGATLKEAMHGFAMSMLASFIDVIAQMIAMKIMASAFGIGVPVGDGGGGVQFDPSQYSAKGNVFRAGVKTFEKGGMIAQPTVFPMANGGMGLAGEAGIEAIMPVGRDSQGRMGVHASGGENKQPIKIVNVVDDSMIEEFLNTGSGERAVLNIMNKNREGGSEAFV